MTTTFAYDLIDQLTSESRTGYSASYTYDANGNRLTKTLNGVTQTYVNDAGDKLTSVLQGLTPVKTFTYDAAGRRATQTASGTTTSYAYNYEDNLISVSVSGGSTSTYGYNGRGSKVAENSSIGNLSLFRTGTNGGARLLGDDLANYTPGAGERRSSATTNYAGDAASYTEQVNSSQQITATRQYDAFGNITNASGTWNGPFGAGSRIGGETFGGTGLVGIGGKAFDPTVGHQLVNWWRGGGQEKGISKGQSPPKPRPKVVIIVGVGVGYGDVWGIFDYYYNEFRRLGYDVIPMFFPTGPQMEAAIGDPSVEGVIYIGHGGGGEGVVRPGSQNHLTPALVGRVRKKKKKLRFVIMETCDSWNDGRVKNKNRIQDWAEVCDEFWGYDGFIYFADRLAELDPGAGHVGELHPKEFKSPRKYAPGGTPSGPRPWIPRGGRFTWSGQ